MLKKLSILIIISWFCILLASCGSPLKETIKEINQRYQDNNPMIEDEIEVRFKESLHTRVVSATTHIRMWVPNYNDLATIKEQIQNGQVINGVFVTFEVGIKRYQELNMETLEMEWKEKKVINAIFAEERAIKLSDLL